MRRLLAILIAVIASPMIGCERSISMATLDQTASNIFDGTIPVDENGQCAIDSNNNVIDNIAYVTTQADGTILILFRTWQGKGSNLRGFLDTNGAPLTIGSEIELLTFIPTGPNGGLPIGRADVSIDAAITKSCYRVSRSLD
jgi:hypothetical protein